MAYYESFMSLTTDGEWEEYCLLLEEVEQLGLAAKAVDFKMAQEVSNEIWQRIGARLGFDWQSVKRHSHKGSRFILAKPLPKPTKGAKT